MNLQVEINEETLQDIINIETGLFYPLDGFMREGDFRSVVDKYILLGRQVFTIPITLDVPENIYSSIRGTEIIDLMLDGICVAQIQAESKYEMAIKDIEKVFCTLDESHPGVYKEKMRSRYRVGGKTKLLKTELLKDALKPVETKGIFADKGWNTVVGFQTRNPIHKAHEHIQRLGLDICDGLFINPIVGWKKKGDFTHEVVIAAYEKMIGEFYPKDRVYILKLVKRRLKTIIPG